MYCEDNGQLTVVREAARINNGGRVLVFFYLLKMTGRRDEG